MPFACTKKHFSLSCHPYSYLSRRQPRNLRSPTLRRCPYLRSHCWFCSDSKRRPICRPKQRMRRPKRECRYMTQHYHARSTHLPHRTSSEPRPAPEVAEPRICLRCLHCRSLESQNRKQPCCKRKFRPIG